MDKLERVYRRTVAGQKAWESKDPVLSNEHQRILGLIEGEIHWDEIKKCLRRHADLLRLDELEVEGFISYDFATAQLALDFTDNFAFR